MSTSPITGSTGTTGTTAATDTSKYNMSTQDFIQMMVTQLQNQDPMDPAKNSDLLNQMSQIGQLQSSSNLQTTLTSMTLQNSLSSAGALIGKSVAGTAADGKTQLTGTVSSVRVADGNVSLQLDSGLEMPLSNVTGITNGTVTSS